MSSQEGVHCEADHESPGSHLIAPDRGEGGGGGGIQEGVYYDVYLRICSMNSLHVGILTVGHS